MVEILRYSKVFKQHFQVYAKYKTKFKVIFQSLSSIVLMQFQQIKCSEHPHQYITNFCCKCNCSLKLESCLVGLCATCICKHTQYHNLMKSTPQYENIKDTFSATNQKLTQFWNSLSQEKNRLNYLVDYIDKSKKQIKILLLSAKDDVYALVQKCFEEIEASFDLQLEKQKQKNGFHTHARFQEIIIELNQQFNDLQSISEQLNTFKFPHIIKVINTTFLPKGKMTLNRISSQIMKNQIFGPEMFYNPNLLPQINHSIKNMINISFKSPLLDHCSNIPIMKQSISPIRKISTMPRSRFDSKIITSPNKHRQQTYTTMHSNVSPFKQSKFTNSLSTTPKTSRNMYSEMRNSRM